LHFLFKNPVLSTLVRSVLLPRIEKQPSTCYMYERTDKYFGATLFKKWYFYWSSCHITASLFCEICDSPSYSPICHLLHAGFLAYSLTLKMEAIYSFKMSADF
jgi:hypothetical protein